MDIYLSGILIGFLKVQFESGFVQKCNFEREILKVDFLKVQFQKWICQKLICRKCISIPSNFLPLSHSVPVLGQLEQLREHWRSFFHVTLTLTTVVRSKKSMMATRMIIMVRRMIMMVCSSNSVLSRP